jgi:hypothetical protein
VKECSTLDLAETPPRLAQSASNAVTPSVLVKTVIVWGLGFILAWRPSLAMRLGKIVTRVWPDFKRA